MHTLKFQTRFASSNYLYGGGRAEKVELDEHVFRGRVHVGRGGWCGLRMSADGLWWPMNLFSNPEMQHACPVTVLRCSALVQ